ncbi:unnamed protein product [Prorocentrum cordatum]|uniref:CBM20 domain-containing protein n=1 Tax=Prorocentrum cordatum TaxID=2364126 RepID=A0ABN9VS23_9DINO|nr:unnamed protein product [Polarella glacialis]
MGYARFVVGPGHPCAGPPAHEDTRVRVVGCARALGQWNELEAVDLLWDGAQWVSLIIDLENCYEIERKRGAASPLRFYLVRAEHWDESAALQDECRWPGPEGRDGEATKRQRVLEPVVDFPSRRPGSQECPADQQPQATRGIVRFFDLPSRGRVIEVTDSGGGADGSGLSCRETDLEDGACHALLGSPPAPGEQRAYDFGACGRRMPFMLHRPAGGHSKKLPLLVFLHALHNRFDASPSLLFNTASPSNCAIPALLRQRAWRLGLWAGDLCTGSSAARSLGGEALLAAAARPRVPCRGEKTSGGAADKKDKKDNNNMKDRKSSVKTGNYVGQHAQKMSKVCVGDPIDNQERYDGGELIEHVEDGKVGDLSEVKGTHRLETNFSVRNEAYCKKYFSIHYLTMVMAVAAFIKFKSKHIPVRQWRRLESRFRAAWMQASTDLREAYGAVVCTGDFDFSELVDLFEAGVAHESTSASSS